MRRTPLKHKPRSKRRAPGVGCRHPGRKSCRRDAVTSIDDVRLCGIHAADRLFSRAVRESGPCWAGGCRFACNGDVQCAHIITRSRHSIRWSTDNAKPLCAGHHVWFTHNPDAWRAFVAEQGIDYDALRQRSFNDPPMNPAEVLEQIRGAA